MAVVNPRTARDFARAIGALANTDAMNARMLAAFVRFPAPVCASSLHRHGQRQLNAWNYCIVQRLSGIFIFGVGLIGGDVAIIHARTSYATAGGEARRGRYTDVWAKRGGRWLAVSAHVTR